MATPVQSEAVARKPAEASFRSGQRGRASRLGISGEARRSLVCHWPEYLMESALLGLFMISACVFTVLVEYPGSPAHRALPSPWLRRALIGIAMGATAVALIYSPWGKRSGAHFNPAVTLTFYRLGKIETWDAIFYVIAQFLGGAAGVFATLVILGNVVRDPSVHYVVTVPGNAGVTVAFLAELAISCGLMLTVLKVMNTDGAARFTGWFAGILVALYITVEGPFSGMSMNPARTFGSAFPANLWTAWWIYFTAPPIGMLLAAELYQRFSASRVICAKLHHQNNKRCIFRCGYLSTQDSAVGQGERS
jgi:aquaporin Z